MKLVQTKDGTFTYFHDEHQQTYHSMSGAYEEAVEKYVKPTQVTHNSVILDYCFGLGYNTLATIFSYDSVHITAIEKDTDLLCSLSQITFQDPLLHALYQQLVGQITQQVLLGKTDFTIIVHMATIRFIVGDVMQAIPRLSSDYFDAIYFDPFSYQKQPELWSQDQFRECYRIVKKDGRLATYSCAKPVRDNMRFADFVVFDGPIIGRKSPGTIGVKKH